MYKIYCAGPLFNRKEQEEMKEISDALEAAGFQVFLPQRDGFEFSKLSINFKEMGYSESDTNRILNKAIFALDVFQVVSSDGLILNINGRVPDEGAMVEAGIAWNAGKDVIIYKNDSRTLINGSDNPLLLGLSDFVVVESITDIPASFRKLISSSKQKNISRIDDTRLKKILSTGEEIAKLSGDAKDKVEICSKLVKLFKD